MREEEKEQVEKERSREREKRAERHEHKQQQQQQSAAESARDWHWESSVHRPALCSLVAARKGPGVAELAAPKKEQPPVISPSSIPTPTPASTAIPPPPTQQAPPAALPPRYPSMPSSHREAAEKLQQQHKEAAPQPFVRPFEDSFQPKAPVSLRNSHTPPAILTSPKQAALSLAPHERQEKVDAAPPGSSKLLLPTSCQSSSQSSSSLPLCVPFVPQSSAAPPQQPPPTPLMQHPPPQDEAKPLPPRPDITAVLNVPDKAKVLAAVKESAAASHNHFARNLHAQRVGSLGQS